VKSVARNPPLSDPISGSFLLDKNSHTCDLPWIDMRRHRHGHDLGRRDRFKGLSIASWLTIS